MQIKNITIKNVRGFDDKTIKLDMIPNKPSLLVAPNGSGKSSFALAFQSLIRDKMSLNKEDVYKRNEALQPEMVIEVDEDNKVQEFRANDRLNEISKNFGIAVINSRVKSEVVKKRVNGQPVSTGKLAIEPIVLENKIPNKPNVTYKFEEKYGLNLKKGIVPSIVELLKSNKLYVAFPIAELTSIKRALSRINHVVEEIKKYNETDLKVEDVRNDLRNVILQEFRQEPKLEQIKDILKSLSNDNDIDELNLNLQAMQLLLCYSENKEVFKQAKEYAEYTKRKSDYIELFNSLKETWQNIKPKEQDGKLIVDIPYANRLSNGERDIIVFMAMLIKARLSLKKDNNILIIDEVFDYLDDANLVAAQYYITELIIEMKHKGKNIFPIILTHLNPDFYNQYFFKDLKVYYLVPLPHPEKSNLMMSLVSKRAELERDKKDDVISRFMLHFHKDYTQDMSDVLNHDQKNANWDNIHKFKEYCLKNMNAYLDDKGDRFCPLAVCVALREWIESYCYNKLPDDAKEGFFEEHGTQKKLSYAQVNGVDCPEIFSLLGLIYNDPLHAKDQKDLRQTLYSRLQNNTIRAMIKRVKEICAQE